MTAPLLLSGEKKIIYMIECICQIIETILLLYYYYSFHKNRTIGE